MAFKGLLEPGLDDDGLLAAVESGIWDNIYDLFDDTSETCPEGVRLISGRSSRRESNAPSPRSLLM